MAVTKIMKPGMDEAKCNCCHRVIGQDEIFYLIDEGETTVCEDCYIDSFNDQEYEFNS